MNKSQRQRIIIFVGHPIQEDLSECENLGKRLKRNNVSIDVINFAHPDNVPKL
jgi:26S proteasome regulatory subunit N10